MDMVIIKGIFLKYILLPLIVVVMAVLLGYMKKKMPKVNNKVLIVYVLLSSLCIAVPGLLGFSGNMFNPYWYLLAMIIYLFLGIFQVNLLSYYFQESSRPMWFIALFEVLVSLTSMLFGGYLFCLIFNLVSPFEGYALISSTSISIFIIPLLFYYSYINYINIPLDIYKTWTYSINNEFIDFDKIEFSSLLVLNLELTKTIKDGQRSRIDAKAPSDGVSVGNWFFRVLDDYNHKYPNAPIHLLDPNGEGYSWIFYTKKSIFHFRRYIDFDRNMRENKITKHTTIICKRVINNEIEGHNSNK